MKKALTAILAAATVLLMCVTAGFFVWRNRDTEPAVIRYPAADELSQTDPLGNPRVDLNTADTEALMTLPGIGAVYAQRIVEYRELHGPFSSVTDLLAVEGFGSGRLEKILDYITIGGQHEDSGR